MESLTYLAIIWGAVYLSGVLAAKIKLTPVLCFLGAGAILVNIGLLPATPDHFIEQFAEIGIIIIMFAVGFEEDSSKFVKSIKKSWGIAFFGAIAPFFTAYFIAQYFWNDSNTSIMCGLTMMATAVSLTMVTLKGEGLSKTPAAMGIMTSAVIDDIASLILLAILVPIATGQADISLAGISVIIGKTVIFFAIIFICGLWILPQHHNRRFSKIPFIGSRGINNILGIADGEYMTLTLLLTALIAGITAHHFGFHPAIGAYMAGLIIKREYFYFKDNNDIDHYKDMSKNLDKMAFSWIGPVFFVTLGTKIIFDYEVFISVLPETIIMTICLIIAQISSASLAARYTGGFNKEDSLLIGLGMLGRAELAFVVIDIAYVQYNIISMEAFYTLMFAAFFMNISVPLSIRAWKKKYG